MIDQLFLFNKDNYIAGQLPTINFSWAITGPLQGSLCSSEVYVLHGKVCIQDILGKSYIESNFTHYINVSFFNFVTISGKTYTMVMLERWSTDTNLSIIGLALELRSQGIMVHLRGVKMMMMITNLTPRIQSKRRWTPNGQNKLRKRRIFSFVIIGMRNEKLH